jgi:glycosyltransferase involved in cell wall biosynthesis
MSRQVLVVRGGALPRSSGLGRAHHDLVDRLNEGQVGGYVLGDVVEHELDGGAFARWRRRRNEHPQRVSTEAKANEGSILHITDQEQAHLIPEGCDLPVSITIHDLFHLEPRRITTSHGKVNIGDQSPGILRRRDLSHLRKGLERADLLICISQATAEEARELWPKKPIAVVPHGIDVAGYDPFSRPLPKPEYLDYSKINLLFVGSEEPRKRIDFLIEVLGCLPSHLKGDVILHKVGAESSQKSKAKLSARAKEMGVKLRWIGRLPDLDLCAYYQHCDALLFPSVAEGFGLPPLEAMASGCPVLVSDMPAHNEVAPEEWLLPHDSVDAWVDSIVKLSTKEGRRQPNQTALKRAAKFSIEAWSKSIASAWNKL